MSLIPSRQTSLQAWFAQKIEYSQRFFGIIAGTEYHKKRVSE